MSALCRRALSMATSLCLVAGVAAMATVQASSASAANCPSGWTYNAGNHSCYISVGYTGSAPSYTMPVTASLYFEVVGGRGGRGGDDQLSGAQGGYGSRVSGTIANVASGAILRIAVGGDGGSLPSGTSPANSIGAAGGSNPLGGYAGGAGGSDFPITCVLGANGPEQGTGSGQYDASYSGGGGGGGAASVLSVAGTSYVAGGGGGGGGASLVVGAGAARTGGPYVGSTSGATGADALTNTPTDNACTSGGGGGGGGGGGVSGGAGGAAGDDAAFASTGGVAGTSTTGSGLTVATASTSGYIYLSYAMVPDATAMPTVPATVTAPTTATGGAGSWSGASSYGYQWLRCTSSAVASESAGSLTVPAGCEIITGATALSYAPTNEDLGSHLRLAVTGTNSTGSTTAISATSSAVTLAAPTVDLVVASDTGVSATDNLTQDTTPTYSISGLAIDDSYTVTATKGSQTLTLGPFTATQSTETHTFSELTDGAWSVTAVQAYGAFTSPPATPVVMTIDTSAPSAPTGLALATASDTGVSSSDGITKDTTPTIDLTGLEVGNKVIVTASKPGSPDVTCVIANVTGASESCTFATPLSSDGEWTFTAVQVDDAGNSSVASSPMTMQLDTSAGVALTSVPAATGTSATAATSFTFTATLTDPPAGTTSFTPSDVTLAGTSTGWAVDPASWTQVSPTQYTFVVSATTPTQGTLIVKAPAGAYDDTAGNTATATVSPDWTSTIVVQPPANSAPPTLSATSGTTTTLGSTLSSTPGTWNDQGDINPSTASRWQVCPDNTGTGCTDIPGATSSTYVPVAAQETLYIRSVVTRTNVKGSTEQASTLVGPMTKSPQDIDFANPGAKTYSPTPFTIAPRSEFVGSSNLTGLTVQMTSLTPDVCSVTGFSVTMLKSGTCTLAANQPGNGEFQAATQVTQSFTINRANDSSVTTPSQSQIEPGQTVTLSTANASTGDDTYTVVSGPCTVSGNVVTSTGSVGDCIISAASAQDDRYSASTAPNITIAIRDTDAITLPTIDDTLSTAGAFTYGGTALSGRTPSLSVGPAGVCTYAAGAITVAGPGTCTVTATLADNGSWSAATASRSFAVVAPPTPATINSVKTGAGDGVLGGSAQVFFTPGPSNGSVVTGYTVLATPAGGGSAVSVTCSVSPCTVTGLVAGDYDFTVTTNATALGTAVTAVSPAMRATVLAAHEITLVNPGARLLYGGSFDVAPASSVDDSWIPTLVSLTPGVCSVAGVTVTPVSQGTCTLVASHAGGTHAGLTYGLGSSTVSFAVYVPYVPSPEPVDPEPPVDPCPAAASDCTCPCDPDDPKDPKPEDPDKPSRPDKPVKPGDMRPPPPPSDVRITPGVNGGKDLVRITLPRTPDRRAIESLVLVVLDADGNVVRRITIDVRDGDRTMVHRVAIPQGGTVRAYTINAAGISAKAPQGANVVEAPTSQGADRYGRPALFGKKIAKPIYFDPESPELDAVDHRILDKVAAYAKRYGGVVYVTGFVKRGPGSEERRQELSAARAQQVAMYLSDLGVRTWINYDGAGAYSDGITRDSDRRVEIRWAKSGIPVSEDRG